MSQVEIGVVLQLIESWVSGISEDSLAHQCRVSGMNFFQYMTQCGVNAGYLARLIFNATGYNPRQLWTVNDVEILRDAIFRYEASIQVAQCNSDAWGTVRHFWGE